MRVPLGADRAVNNFQAIGRDARISLRLDMRSSPASFAMPCLIILFVGIHETKRRLRVTNVAPAAAGNMQELRGKVPKGIAFVDDWIDAAGALRWRREMSAHSCCVSLKDLCMARAYLSGYSPFRRRY